ncbi:MAG: glycosyltransferase family 4 protein [Candidatus Cloacimonetes bacterium]|nr:glycosyltransferase family 4 protein [Candidatus Cloacimonadota bacterium]
MNICLVNNIFPPILTGSSLFTFDLAFQLAKVGHNVIVITSMSSDTDKEFEIHSDGYKVYRLKKLRLSQSSLWMNFPDFYFTLFPSNFKRVRSILLENRIEIIHQCNNIFDLVFLSAYFSHKLNIPLFCSLTTPIQHANRAINKVLELFDKTVVRFLFSRYVSCYITGDRETERYVEERYKRKKGVKTIHYGVSGLGDFAKIDRDYRETTNVVVSLGHVSSGKDRKELIEAWPKIVSSIPSAKLQIIGSLFSDKIGILIEKYNIAKHVLFSGGVQRSKIPELIEKADLGCLFVSNVPFCKGVGSANIELMASGLPVILDAYDDNFGSDMPFKNGVHFIKLESRDPDWLAEKIVELMNDSELRERIGKAGQEFVLTQLTWGRVLPLIEALYRSYIQNND